MIGDSIPLSRFYLIKSMRLSFQNHDNIKFFVRLQNNGEIKGRHDAIVKAIFYLALF